MTEWWLLIAFFWLWFLADGLKIFSRNRFVFRAHCGRKVRALHGRLLFSAPSPLLWRGLGEDPPYSFSPDGIANVPAGSAGRPALEPATAAAWRWEDIREVKQRRGRILINGADFCPASSFASAADLRTLAAQVAPLAPPARAALLAARISLWFRPEHLRRRRRVLVARTRTLAEFGCLNLGIALLVTLYLLTNGPNWIGDAWAGRLARALPLVALYFGGVHLVLVILGWRVHRRLLPQKSEQRLSLTLNALLLPQMAIRLRAQIAPDFFPPQHPLAWLAALGLSKDFKKMTRNVVADLRWPLPPRQYQNEPLINAIASWARIQIAHHASRLIATASLPETELLAPPPPDSPASCAYCPRCLDQFVDPAARCPRGIKPLALK